MHVHKIIPPKHLHSEVHFNASPHHIHTSFTFVFLMVLLFFRLFWFLLGYICKTISAAASGSEQKQFCTHSLLHTTPDVHIQDICVKVTGVIQHPPLITKYMSSGQTENLHRYSPPNVPPGPSLQGRTRFLNRGKGIQQCVQKSQPINLDQDPDQEVVTTTKTEVSIPHCTKTRNPYSHGHLYAGSLKV